MFQKISITEDMRAREKEESIKRSNYINHHFEVKHFSTEQRDVLGFLG